MLSLCIQRATTYLLHNTSLPLGESDMATRLILYKLDLNLAALTTGLIIIVIVILGAHAAALGAAGVSAVAGLLQLIVTGRKLLVRDSSHVGHDGSWYRKVIWEVEGDVGASPKGEGNREDTQSSNAVWDRRVERRNGRGRAKKAKCELRWAGGQSRVGEVDKQVCNGWEGGRVLVLGMKAPYLA